MAKRVPPDMHVQCYEWPQLLGNYYLQNVGQEWEDVGWGSLIPPSSPMCSFSTAFLYLLSLFKLSLSFKVLPRSLLEASALVAPLLEGPPPCSSPHIFSSFKVQLESPSQKVSPIDSELAQPDHLCPSIYILSSSFSAYFPSSPWLA